MRQYLLLFDVGNTNIKIGFADAKGLEESYSLPTDHSCTADCLGLRLDAIVRHFHQSRGLSLDGLFSPRAIVAVSVAPSIDPLLRQACRRFFQSEMLFAPVDLPIPLENRYARPLEVGADRLMSAYAAKTLYPGDKHVVVDFGTATTFDCVDGEAYLGGLICPGLLSSARALSTQTAKLPQISLELDSTRLNIGRSTRESLNQGLLFGFAAMVEGLVARLTESLGGEPTITATGGFSTAIAKLTPIIQHVRPDLLLEGLRLLYSASGREAADTRNTPST